jgi:3-hydroxybutyryl-CoA dehydrogenase
MRIGVVGAGTMGHGIATVCASAGFDVVLADADRAALDRGLGKITQSLDKAVEKGKLGAAERDAALARVSGGDLRAASAGADLVIEAVPERLALKQDLFRAVEAVAPATCILATNTSSLSVAKIASAVADPGRVIGTHFFNPVPVMALLELVVTEATRPEVVAAVQAFGQRIGKELITVRDTPGFATS